MEKPNIDMNDLEIKAELVQDAELALENMIDYARRWVKHGLHGSMTPIYRAQIKQAHEIRKELGKWFEDHRRDRFKQMGLIGEEPAKENEETES